MYKIRMGLFVSLLTIAFCSNAIAYGIYPIGSRDCSPCHGTPEVTDFQLPASHDALTVPITSFAAIDNDPQNKTSVNGYMLTLTPTAPGPGDTGWQSSPPSQYTFTGEGVQTLYAWARNSFETVSAAMSDAVDIMILVNTPPVAEAGPNQSAVEGSTVTLDGTNSRDIDGDTLEYYWEQTDGPVTVALMDALTAQPTFEAPVVGPDGVSLTFTLTVTDGSGETHSDTCIVNITNVNIDPMADAGPDQTVAEGETVFLDGSGSDGMDDGIVAYQWEQIDITGAVVTLSDATIANPDFVLTSVGPNGESVTLQLTVTDEGGLQDTDTVVINVTDVITNQAPTADAGNGQSVMAGDEVTLDASGSSDPDGPLANNAYTWEQTAGTAVTLSDPGAVKPVFTAPAIAAGTTETLTFELTVTDGMLQATAATDVQVTAESVPPVEEPPVEEPPVEEPPVEEPPVEEPPVEEPPVEEPPTSGDDSDSDSDSDSYDNDDDDDDDDRKRRDHNKREHFKRFWKQFFDRD